MRGAVLQLHRWGLLSELLARGTPPIRETTFHYGEEAITIPIKERDGVDGLIAPRRTMLDEAIVDSAIAAGAEILHGLSVVDLRTDPRGRVVGAGISSPDRKVTEVTAELVIGADGIRSRVARLIGAPLDGVAGHTTASIYAYWSGLGLEGNHWYYDLGAAVGAIPTNDGETCVFASVSAERFESERRKGLKQLYTDALGDVSPDLARRVSESEGPGKLRAFAGQRGFLRRATGPGWALVGDAGFFRDPITAHGITDALREAEFLARAVLQGEDALVRYQAGRDERVRGLFAVTDRISSFDWTLDEVQGQHLVLAKEMNELVDEIRSLDEGKARHAA
jgi:2-polyprenyl-6-methoxyphenol hydroxylase-like FAD-dependent oxidoreductase